MITYVLMMSIRRLRPGKPGSTSFARVLNVGGVKEG